MPSFFGLVRRALRARFEAVAAWLSAKNLSILIRPALVIAIAVAFLVNLMPLKVTASLDTSLAELITGFVLRSDDSISVSLVQRLIVYLPLGLLTYAAFRLHRGKAPFLGTVLVIATVGLGVEIMQSFLSTRHAFLVDFLLVLAIGGLAALLGEIAAGLAGNLQRALGQILILGNLVVLSAILLAHGGSDLDSWDCSYPLIIGNEATSDRPWLGKLRGIAIYPDALVYDDVLSLSPGFSGPDPEARREQLGAGVTYVFQDNLLSISKANEAAVPSPAPETEASEDSAAVQLDDNELKILRPVLIEARRDVPDLCQAIKRADAFTIEIELASLDLQQRGPARILSMSLDPERRNVTLAQDRRRLSLRIRNALNGENGIEQEIVTANDVLSGDWQHWIARYDRGRTSLFLNGVEIQPPLDYETILLVGGRRSVHLAMIAGLVSFVLGAAAFWWLGGRHDAGASPVLAAGLLAFLPQATMILAIAVIDHRGPGVAVLLSIGLSTCIGLAFGWSLARSETTRQVDLRQGPFPDGR